MKYKMGSIRYGLVKLYYVGNIDLMEKEKLVAVVGSRNISNYGKQVIDKLIPGIVEMGVVLISGMAIGVDAYAMEKCLDYGGRVIGVLASGPDVATPKINQKLYERILGNNGLVVSLKDFGFLTNDKRLFLERNKLIASISEAVLVIEGGENSGSINTAREALEIGKEVGAIPGRIVDENSKATNYLIKCGAALIEDISDLHDLLQ